MRTGPLAGSRVRNAAKPLLLAACAVACVLPMLVRGVPEGSHDLALHLAYTDDLKAALGRGELYPRWFPSMNEGQGSPIFLIQYPLPYYVLAAIEWIAGDPIRAIAAYSFLWIFLSGYWCYLWLREEHGEEAALAAGAAYMALPFHLAVCTYVRWAIGELAAVAALPLALYSLGRRPWSSALAFSLLLLSHPPTFALAIPFFAVVLLVRGEARLIRRLAWAVGGSLVLCAGYVVRLVLHQPRIMGKPVMSYESLYVFFDDRFFDLLSQGIGWMPAGTAVADWLRGVLVYESAVRHHGAWPLLYSLCFTWLALAIAMAVITIRRKWAPSPVAMALLAGLCTYLTSPWSDWVIRAVPAIQGLQFPSRFLVIHSVCAALLVAAALEGLKTRAWRAAAAFGVLGPLALGSAAMLSTMSFSRKVESVRVDTMYEAYGGRKPSLELSRGVAPMQPIPGRQVLNLLCYPGWEASTADGGWVRMKAEPETNLCVAAEGRLRFDPPVAERIGMGVSFAALLALGWRRWRSGP